jgi:recombinational DNA repair protein (RecF pathway)
VAYQTYTTDALVVGSEDRLTADRLIVLFTREAGLVHARAISVRREKSKLRYGLQDFSLVRVSLVRGKQGWRIIGAERADNLYFSAGDRHVRGALLRVLKLVRRLVRGEETHVALYDILTDGLHALSVCAETELVRGERVLMLRILSTLGYIAPEDAYTHALAAASLREALSSQADSISEERAVRVAIDEALLVSQL